MKKTYILDEINTIDISLSKGNIIFLKGDLSSGKTTLSKYIINGLLGINEDIISPTYTYYNKYSYVYHFDLYRLKDYDEFFAIGGEDILDNNAGIIIIEWPEILEKYYTPDIIINLRNTNNINEREIEIIYKEKNNTN